MSRIGCGSLLTGRHIRAKMYTANAVPTSNASCEWRHGSFVVCVRCHAAHIGTLIWYFLNGEFGSFDLSCSPHRYASALSWHSPSKPASSLVWLIANTQTRPAIAVFRQFSKQDLLPPCSINKIHKTLYSIRNMVAGWSGT